MKSDAARIRPAIAADFPAILALNAALVHFLSPLDAARLRLLHAQAAYHRVAEIDGGVVAFLLAFREGAAYDSPRGTMHFLRHRTRQPVHLAIADGLDFEIVTTLDATPMD